MIFIFILALQPNILRTKIILPIQMTFAIPFLLTSIFARAKLSYATKPRMWEKYGFVTFLIGYSLLINVIGILLSLFVGLKVGLYFFFGNMLLAVIYSTLDISEDKSKMQSRVWKDLLFILILIFGGILPALGVY